MSETISGRLEGNQHRLTQRVYYEDTDFSGSVYHARYLHFLERGRTDFLRCLGIEQRRLAQSGDNESLTFVVRHMDIDFRAPAAMDDLLDIVTEPQKVGGARLVLHQEVHCGDRLLVTAQVTVAIVNREGRARRMPEHIAAKLGL
ncbi:MAG: tol-pal system-associated acyl-CoA thioesterase [Pseudomonadota bacterium]